MQKIAFSIIFLIPLSSFSAENCKPIYKSEPISFSVSGKKGGNIIDPSSQVVTGNQLSPIQPADKLIYAAGTLAFSLTPVASCKEGVQVNFENSQNKKEQLLVWGKPTIVDGESDSEYFVKVIAIKIKP